MWWTKRVRWRCRRYETEIRSNNTRSNLEIHSIFPFILDNSIIVFKWDWNLQAYWAQTIIQEGIWWNRYSQRTDVDHQGNIIKIGWILVGGLRLTRIFYRPHVGACWDISKWRNLMKLIWDNFRTKSQTAGEFKINRTRSFQYVVSVHKNIVLAQAKSTWRIPMKLIWNRWRLTHKIPGNFTSLIWKIIYFCFAQVKEFKDMGLKLLRTFWDAST